MTDQMLMAALGKGDMSALQWPLGTKEEILNNPMLADTLEQLRQKAEALRGTPILSIPFAHFKHFDTTGERATYEGGRQGYFVRRVRLVVFGLMAWLYGGEDNLQELENIIWAICDEYSWCLPAHQEGQSLTRLENEGYTIDLFSSETAQTLSEICFLLGDSLHPLLIRRVRHQVRERVVCRFLEMDCYWEHWQCNWAAVCGGAVGMAAIYTADHDEELCRVLQKLELAFASFMQGFSDDGVCLEGLDYWTYGFSYYVAFADMLLRRTGGEIDMLAPERVRRVARFQPKCFFPHGQNITFSDAHGGSTYIYGLLCYLRRRVEGVMLPEISRRQMSVSDGCGRWAVALRNLIWADPEPGEYRCGGCYPLPDAQWYICTTEDQRVSLAAKAGHNLDSHNHNDVGSFHAYCMGEPMLLDLGSGVYSKQYFSAEHRYEYLCCCSRGHNVPIIGGRYQLEGRQWEARDVHISNDGICMDIAGAYGHENLASFVREIRFDRRTGSITLQEHCRFADAPESVVERFILPEEPGLGPGLVSIRSGQQRACLRYDAALFVCSISTELHLEKPVWLLDLQLKNPAMDGKWTIRIDFPADKEGAE